MIAGITSVYDQNTVILAGLGAALVTVTLTFYAMTTKINIQVFNGFI
jgi:FtsH-binding integral membrane protein